MIKYKVKVPDVSLFIRHMKAHYIPDFSDMEVKALKEKGVVSITQREDGLNPVDIIDYVLSEIGGEYI